VAQVVTLGHLLDIVENSDGSNEVDKLSSGQQVQVRPAILPTIAVPGKWASGDEFIMNLSTYGPVVVLFSSA
jgi:hypothetical protein